MKKRVAKTLYEKRGNKFIPVGKDDFILPYGFGDYLVRVRKGSKNIRWCKTLINVDYASLEIALCEAADAIAKAISKVSEMRPQSRPWTPREKKAWKEYKRIAGHENLTLWGPSVSEIAEKASLVLRDRLRKMRAGDSGVPVCPEGCIDIWAEKSSGVKR
jgi:hypothetical protein